MIIMMHRLWNKVSKELGFYRLREATVCFDRSLSCGPKMMLLAPSLKRFYKTSFLKLGVEFYSELTISQMVEVGRITSFEWNPYASH